MSIQEEIERLKQETLDFREQINRLREDEANIEQMIESLYDRIDNNLDEIGRLTYEMKQLV